MKRLALILGIFTLLLVSLSNAQQRWERNYGGASYDWGNSVQQTLDGGYIVAGGTNSFGSGEQVYLVKANVSGDTLWTRNYGGAGEDWSYSVRQTQDGGYVVAGSYDYLGTDPQVYLVKTNASGDTLWTRTYGGTGRDIGYSVQQTQDGGYIVAGTTASFGNWYQVYLIKTNATGDTLWTRVYGGVNDEECYSVQQTTDTGYIVAGYTNSFGDSFQVYLIKTNAFGDTLWTRTYGGTGDDRGFSVQQTTDGGYIVVGWTNSFGDSSQVYLVKTNASGNTLWTKTYGGTNDDDGRSVRQTTDGGYIVAGWANSFGNGWQVYLIKTDASGDTLWNRTYGRASSDGCYSVQQTQDGGYIVAGGTTSFGNSVQVYLIKTDANGNVGVETPFRQIDGSKVRPLKVTPNPFTSFATVPGHSSDCFALYDISGRRVGVYKGDRIGEGLSPGVYFLKLDGKDQTPARVVKLR